jgi:hypothetical protein
MASDLLQRRQAHALVPGSRHGVLAAQCHAVVPALRRNADTVRPGEQDGSKPALARGGQEGQHVTNGRTKSAEPGPRRAATLAVPQPQPSERRPARTAEPYDLPVPGYPDPC